MIGIIAFAVKQNEENIYVTVEENKVLDYKKEKSENLFSKITYFNDDNSDMTNAEYEQFADENDAIVELLADLEVQL